MAEVKYFQSKLGNIVSNGKVKFRFSSEVLRVDNPLLVDLLNKSKSVKEVSEEEAEKLNPLLFENYEKKESNEDDGNGEGEGDEIENMTKPALKEKALELGVSEDDLKEPILKDALVKIVKDAMAKEVK